MRDVQSEILEKLCQIEAEHQIKIPLAVESGSRAWGFASPDSDYDCRFVYVRPKDDYLTVFTRKDTIDYAPDAVFDLSGWDLRKFITHLVKSNAVMLEWLRSGVFYRRDHEVSEMLWQLGRAYFDPVATVWHYLSMARNNLGEILSAEKAKIKRYFYVMRPLACARFILEHGEVPFMEYSRNLGEITVPDVIREEICELMARKEHTDEGMQIAKNQPLVTYFMREVSELEKWLGTAKHEKLRDYDRADRCFRELVERVSAHGRY